MDSMFEPRKRATPCSRVTRWLRPSARASVLRSRVQVKSLTPNVLSISAKGKTAAQAERTTNAVANSYVAYVRAANSAVGPVQAQLVEAATSATGMSVPGYLLVTAGPGVLLGVLIGAIVALAISRRDRRLRERDEIANAIGVPVLASIPVGHPADAGRWTKLLEDYEPSVVHAWQLRNAMRYLRQTDVISANGSNGNGFSLAVLSLSSDRGALALGPQLAVFAASLGIPTTLVIDPQQDANALAQLRAACAAPPSSRRSSKLQVAVTDDHHGGRQPAGALTVVVAVVDSRAPRVADRMRTSATVLGVSAGAATAEQLARVALATDDRGQIDGILVADPDPADRTTGRVPQLVRPARPGMPTRLNNITTETRR